jgi:hypothetical protein
MKIKNQKLSIKKSHSDKDLIFKSFQLSILIFFILQFSFFNLQCKKPTPPDIDDTPKPGKGDCAWTIDTLAALGSMQTIMQATWGTSAQNVYVVGYNEVTRGKIYHYDGNRWNEITLPYGPGQPFRQSPQLNDIHGTSSSNILAVGTWSRATYDHINDRWIITDSSFIMHYNGINWREVKIERKRLLGSISGFKRESLWATGYLGSAYSFNGQSWKIENVPMDFDTYKYNWGITATSDGKNKYMIISAYLNSTGQSQHYFWMKRDTTWVLRDSFYVGFDNFTPRFGGKFFFLPSGELYSVGYAFFKWSVDSWENIYQRNITLTSVWGTRTDHLFICGSQATILHFNGIDWHEYHNIGDPYWSYYGVWCDENEVFIVGNDGNKTYIIHGR